MLIPSQYNKVYLDPTFEEIQIIGKDRWDTLRLLMVFHRNGEENYALRPATVTHILQ